MAAVSAIVLIVRLGGQQAALRQSKSPASDRVAMVPLERRAASTKAVFPPRRDAPLRAVDEPGPVE